MSQAQGIRVGRVLGIPIYVDFSWILIFGAFCFILQKDFAESYKGWGSEVTWAAGVATSILFFTSVVLHELAHSVVSQAYKIKVLSITLFIFGGLARISREPSKAIQEFNIALAGPVASGLLCGIFLGLSQLFGGNEKLSVPLGYLASANGILAVFNLLPGFPLDGGRIFRAIVWGATKDFSRATRIAGASGKLIAYALIVLGLWSVFITKDYSKIWFILIGLYLLNAAQMSVAQVTIRESLAGLHAADVMAQEVPTIPGNMSLEEYSNEALRTGRRVHIVTMGDRLAGLMNVAALNQVPRDEWNMNSVQAVMVPRDKIIWAAPEEPLLRLLERLMAADINQMPVVKHGEDGSANIVGIVTRDAILRVIQTRSELAPR
ncbi:MAG TPA: site-2 protease family protein [Terriglobales bacterium]|nr:site-2 protease family protein [Terriglobales bacterium]